MDDHREEQSPRRVSALSAFFVLVGIAVLAAIVWQGLILQQSFREKYLNRSRIGEG